MGVLEASLAAVTGGLAATSALNALLMVRPSKAKDGPDVCALIPARNEAGRIGALAAELRRQGMRVYVFDDESEDGTGEEAAAGGAVVIRPAEPLPEGWKGKNRACRELARAASEDFAGEWAVFLDADVLPRPGFAAGLRGLIGEHGRRFPVITGFPAYLPGRGLEPAYLQWMTWLLLATNPFWLVGRTRRGHNFFTNGQVTAWRLDAYWELDPHKAAKERILEDVAIGRMLARRGIPALVANLGSVLAVRMYDTLPEAFDGMTKNSAEIAGPGPGSWLLAAGLLAAAWGWIAWPPALILLAASAAMAARVSRHPWWTWPLLPLSLTAAAATVIRSLAWRAQGRIAWKGRIYKS
jgi:glycosyltransferase involved in cell wall biosynthesis